MNPDLLNDVAKIGNNLELISTLLKVIVGAGGVISALLIYIYKSGQKMMVTEIGHVDKKAEIAIGKADEIETKREHDMERVTREFVSVQSCDRRH